MQQPDIPTISRLVFWRDYYERETWQTGIWPTVGAFRHFIRSRMTQLSFHRGVVILSDSRTFIDPETFPAVAARLLSLPTNEVDVA